MFTKNEVMRLLDEALAKFYATNMEEAEDELVYKAVSLMVRDVLIRKKNEFNARAKGKCAKRVYYLCMEFLVGRSLRNNLCNLGLEKIVEECLAKKGRSLTKLYEIETDAGLGNGGLGRLAACFFDALSTGDYPALGFSLRYEFGLFKQRIVEDSQVELPDSWLDTGEVWLLPRSDKTFRVNFGGYIEEKWEQGRLKIEHREAEVFEAVPYDMMMSGADSSAVSVLRLWKARSVYGFNMRTFSEGSYAEAMRRETEAELLTKVLYPADEHSAGKTLRLSQQYFLVSASVQNIIKDHLRIYPSLDNLAEKAAVHINDTHPALAIPELLRILLDEYGYSYEAAWHTVINTVAYTNHTVMAEALETWDEDLISSQLPRIYQLIREIDRRLTAEIACRYPDNPVKAEAMRIIKNGKIHMANLAVAGSHSINGVSALHSGIIARTIFSDFYEMYPERFTNVTNGIAHRRWLSQSNPGLNTLITDLIGGGFKKNAGELRGLAKFASDTSVIDALAKIKRENKVRFCEFMGKAGVAVNPDSRFDVQIKRLHEYKRQLLNILRIISLYEDLREGKKISPQTFIFGAKAAPSYYHAKRIIKLINVLSRELNSHPDIRKYLNVVFVENYNVSVAEVLLPASEVSQQISLAGKEASGTSNMKFMLNGAITMGTLDGANVEICEAVGRDNCFIFGMTASDVEELWRHGYYASYFYSKDTRLKTVIDFLKSGLDGDFTDIAAYLTTSGLPDPYMCMADFPDYMRAHSEMDLAYTDTALWNRMALSNIAEAGRFSADRSIAEYAEKIWGLAPVTDK